ncbi:MAG: DUF2807 domain-containing protein [Rikenellaceae bacterium]
MKSVIFTKVKGLFLLCAALFISAVVAEVSAVPLAEVTLSQFESLVVEADMDINLVEVSEGEPLRMEYDLGDNDPSKFKVDVRRGVLKISQPYNARSVSKIKATLYYNSALSNIEIDRATAKFVTTFAAPIAQITVDDSAMLEGEVDCADLELTAESNARLLLNGSCDYVLLKAKSAAKVELRKLDTRSLEIEVSHGAAVAVACGERMKVSTSTSGVIKYWGEPTILRRSNKLISGSLQKQD